MGNTNKFGFPYAELNNPPHGPNQQKALAESVENEIVTVNTNWQAADTTINATIATLSSSRNMRSLGGRIATTTGAIETNIVGTEVNIDKLNFENTEITSGLIYIFHIKLAAVFSGIVAGDAFNIRIRKDTSLTGTGIITIRWFPSPSSFTQIEDFSHMWSAPTTDSDADFYISLERISGTGSITQVNGNSETAFWIDEILDSSLWTLVP